jgi:hypothetical protein
MLRRFERLLDLRAGELERGLLLFAYLFLVIGSFVTGKAVRDALFLDEFGALLLPYADIAVALLVFVWVAAYLRISGRVTLRNLIVGSLLFFAVNCLLFRVLSANVHGLADAGHLHLGRDVRRRRARAGVDARQLRADDARGEAAVTGSSAGGATAGWIVGGYVTQVAVKAFGAESTLIGMAVALLLSAGIVVRLWQQRPIGEEPLVAADEARPGILTSVRMIWASPYLKASRR